MVTMPPAGITATTGPDRGRVGRRVLVCVQTIEIGRLTTDPIYLVPGGLIAVTGEGPIDSNQSAKTTLEAAISLLLGDPGWNQESTLFSSYACELLFDPPNAPRDARVRADTGYIVGVFVDVAPSVSGWLVADLNPITVWLRLHRHGDKPLEVAVADGVQLAAGDTHPERLADAARIWASLRGPRPGPRSYANALYGPGVVCLSYVSTRGGRAEQRDRTLLGSDISQLSPEQIAGQLIDLAGMRSLFDTEVEQRRQYTEQLRAFERKRKATEQARKAADEVRGDLGALQRSLELLTAARRARDCHAARVTLEILDELAGLRAQLTTREAAAAAAQAEVERLEAELHALTPDAIQERLALAEHELAQAKSARAPMATQHQQLQLRILQAEQQLAALAEPAARWSGRPAAIVAAELAVAQGRRAAAQEEAAVARSRRTEAAERVAAARRGDGGAAGTRLDAAGVSWQSLHDGVTLTEAGRVRFEPLLRPFDGALCVASEDRDDALAAVADLPGVLLVAAEETPLPPEVLAAPPGAAGLLAWLDRQGEPHPHGAVLAGVLAVTGGFGEPTTGHTARARAAERALRDAEATLTKREAELERRNRDEQALAAEHEAAGAARQRAALLQELGRLRSEMATVMARLQPLNDAVEHARDQKARATADLEGLADRRRDLAAHLRTCRLQLKDESGKVRELAEAGGRYQLPAWLDHLARATQGRDGLPTAPRVAGADLVGLDLLQLPAELTGRIRTHASGVLAGDDGLRHHDHLARLEAELNIDVKVDIGRKESTQARVIARHGELDVVVRLGLERYHAQAAVVARRRSRDSEEREVVALDQALDALAAWLGRQADTLQAAVTRAEARYQEIRLERDEAQDELTANHARISNIQRGLEHQARGLFDVVSTRFNEIRWRDGGYGGDLDYEVAAPPLELSPDGDGEVDEVIRRRWRLTVTPRWARRPPDHGTVDHVPYRDQANTAQYKLATVQLVLAALLANEDPIGRVLILDELGDGLGDAHRDRVLDALHRAATETGITILVTVQDDMQHETFERSAEVLVLRYASEQELLNEPTRMFATRHREDSGLELIALADALTTGRGPGWSALLSAFDAVQAQQAAAGRSAQATQEPRDGGHDGDTEDDDRPD